MELVSSCCGASGMDYIDYGICPDCKEHCDFNDLECLDVLEDMLKKHDWYYQYSDDHRVYMKGSKERDEIIAYLSYIKETYPDLIDDGDDLFNKYRPVNA